MIKSEPAAQATGLTQFATSLCLKSGLMLLAIGLLVSNLARAAEPTTKLDASSTSTSTLKTSSAMLEPLSKRFANLGQGGASSTEVPDFQRHIGPLLGHLGCNGRACHGSFQGRGGFQLSLFGYDFKTDYAALLSLDTGRVDTTDVDQSLILAKPTDADLHEGGKRMDVGSWQHQVLRHWIAAGAPFTGKLQTLDRLEVTPNEILFAPGAEQVLLKAIAHWADGTHEDVTELCRFATNDDAIAAIDAHGVVKSAGAGDTHLVVCYDKAVVPVSVLRPNALDRSGIVAPRQSTLPIDQLVLQKLDKLRIIPSESCDDFDFIRRASLDVTGILPSSERVTQFVADKSTDKRAVLIDELLAEPGYAAWWATRFSDWTGNNEEQLNNFYPVRGTASQSWFAWLEKRLADNVAYDDIIEGIVVAETRLPGESYVDYCKSMSEACRTNDDAAFAARPGLPQYWGRNNFRMPEERAIGFAYTFLGIRIQCAQCHKHPFDQWSKDDFDKFAVLFSSVQANGNNVSPDAREDRDKMLAAITGGKDVVGGELRKLIYVAAGKEGVVVPFPELVVREGVRERLSKEDKLKAKDKNAKKQNAKPPIVAGHILGELETITLQDDPRDSLMSWLRQPNNPYFAKAIVNRVWSNYFGIGIVNPTDDMNLGNPPSNGPLLDYLADEFVQSGYNLKSLHRMILNSDTYQRRSQPNVTNAADQRNFSRHVPRRLPAEVIRDSVYLATANDTDANEARQTLAKLAISGRISGNGKKDGRDFALQVFGQSVRESNCDCDRSDQANLLQSIYLQNDIDMHRSLNDSNGWVSKTSMALTGQPLRTVVGDQSQDNGKDPGGKTKSAESIREQLSRRIEMFHSMPAKKQLQVRPKLEKELTQANTRLEKMGLEKVSLNTLVNGPSDKTVDETKPRLNETTGVEKSKQVDAFKQWATSAYLRVLNRTPDNDELQTAVAYINESSSPGEGLESLMWTLLNTKEFILSH